MSRTERQVMSRLKRPNGDDYPEAARKHLQDADVLFRGRRFDSAAYLAGYVVECALKTLIQVESGQARRSHELADLRDEMQVLAVHAKTRAGRLYVSVAARLETAAVLGWKPEMRYRGPEMASSDAEAWLQEAREVYGRIVGSLVLEGAI